MPTSLKSHQGFGKRGESEQTVLYMIVVRLELSRVMDAIFDIDGQAIVSQSALENVDGGQGQKYDSALICLLEYNEKFNNYLTVFVGTDAWL